MGNNILRAILNIASFKNNNLKNYASTYLIRINAVGEQLEFYIKDALSSSFKLPYSQKEAAYSKVFCYLGNQNHPPDMIVNKEDAYEIKKIKNPFSTLALNSSPPKDKLRCDDPRITSACRICETPAWKEKDLFYVIGNANKECIRSLFFIQGSCYAANHDIYDKIHQPIKKEVDSILDSLGLEKGKTRELGKVKKVDPLGITELRIRGMWSIKNPLKIYEDICHFEDDDTFNLFALIKKEKYLSYPKEDIKELESNKEISVKDVKIKDPNNPAKLIEAKLISYKQK
jgi:hypothetical protein